MGADITFTSLTFLLKRNFTFQRHHMTVVLSLFSLNQNFLQLNPEYRNEFFTAKLTDRRSP